jgi:iron-sulfur cluster assembly accessory protein
MRADKSRGTAMSAAAAGVVVTDRAISRIREILSGETQGTKLRVSVQGGGCSGFRYDFGFDREAAADDIRIEKDGVTVLVDSVSLPFLAGSEIDFVDELIGASFQIRNPNATSSCGCGTSFSV